MEKDEEDTPLPLVPWDYDASSTNNSLGVQLLPRVTGFRIPIRSFRHAIEAIDVRHQTLFAALVPHVITDDTAFMRAVKNFRRRGGSFLRDAASARGNLRYTWAVEAHEEELVSLKGHAWLEYRPVAGAKNVGTVYYSTQADGYVMPDDIVRDFAAAFDRHKQTFDTEDCRVMITQMIVKLGAKSIGRNVWFVPAKSNLALVADLVNAINKLAGYQAILPLEMVGSEMNNKMVGSSITGILKKQLAESRSAMEAYVEDLREMTRDPTGRMHYKSRATQGYNEISLLLDEVRLYSDVLGMMQDDILKEAAELNRNWNALTSLMYVRSGKFNAAHMLSVLAEVEAGKSVADIVAEQADTPPEEPDGE